MVDRLEVIALFITRLICCDSCLDVQTTLPLLMYYCSVEQDLNGTFVACVLCCRNESEEAV